jgi:hypothetical protein
VSIKHCSNVTAALTPAMFVSIRPKGWTPLEGKMLLRALAENCAGPLYSLALSEGVPKTSVSLDNLANKIEVFLQGLSLILVV